MTVLADHFVLCLDSVVCRLITEFNLNLPADDKPANLKLTYEIYKRAACYAIDAKRHKQQEAIHFFTNLPIDSLSSVSLPPAALQTTEHSRRLFLELRRRDLMALFLPGFSAAHQQAFAPTNPRVCVCVHTFWLCRKVCISH